MRITFRGNPRLDDLKHTARTLMRQQARKFVNSSGAFQSYTAAGGGVDAVVNEQWVDGFCVAFRNLILSDNANPRIRWFYGMRDFYSFVSMMKRHIDNRLGDEIGQSLLDNRRKSSFLHLMQWALQINFGGHPDPDIEKTVIQTLSKAILGNGSTLSICAWEPASTALPTTTTTGLGVNTAVCDMCARLQWYDARVRDPTTEFNLVTYVKTGTPCPTIINHQATVRSSLVYALYRTPPEVVRLYRVRNVLLFSRGNAGVELLFRLGYVHNDAEVIDPRDPAHVTPQQIMTDLSRVRRCLRTNRTLILVRAAHLYEAMFDVLNQHFAIEPRGDEYCFYSTLTVDGFTSTVRVSPDHRIILVEDEANINKLTAPFLNRCIKVHLDFESALSAPQRRLFNHVKADVEHHGNCVPKMLIPGYSDETLASHILNIDVAPDASQSTVRSLVGDVWGWLWTLVCPRRWHQARLGLIPQITEEANSKWCCNPIGSELEHLIRRPHIVTTSNDDDDAGTGAAVTENNEVLGEDEEEVDGIKLRQHLLVFTEQREIPGRQLIETMLRLFGAQRCDPSKIVPINFLQDDALDPLISGTVGTSQNNATVGIFVVDMSAINGDAGSVKLDGLLHRVARCSQHRHIVVVAVLPSTSKPPTVSDTSGFGRLTWRLSDRSDWTLIFLDEVVPPELLPVDPRLLVPASESDDDDDNDEEAADQEYDDADKSLTDADDEEDDDVYDAKDMIRLQSALRQAFAAVGTMRSRAIAQHLGSGESVKLLERAVVSLFDLKTPAFDCLADMFVAGMKMLPVMASNPAWTKLAILTVASSDSLRDQLTTFLVNLGQRAAQLVIPVLMEENSHYHAGSGAAVDNEVCDDDDDDATLAKEELRDVFTALLHSSLVPTVDYAECIQQQGHSHLALPSTSIQLVNDVCRFPFSLRLQQKLDTAETTEVQRAIYDSLFMSLARAPSAELVRLYSADLVRRASKLSFAECDVIASLLLLNIADYNSLTIVDVHAHLSSHSQWLDCAYEWVRGLSALALDDARVTLRAWALEHHAPLDDDDDDGDEASHLRKNNTDDDDSTGEDEEQVEEDETQFPGFYITILRCCQRKLIDVAAAQSPHGIIPLSKVNAIAGLCPQLRDCWDLKLHSGLAMLPPAADRELIGTGYDDIKGLLACKKPSDVIRYVFDHYSPVIDLVIHSLVQVVLPPEEENTSASMTLRTTLVDHAVGCEGFPHALWASVLRSLIRKWRDNPGTTLDTFIGPALTYHVHSNPDSERSSVVSRCFFDVWHENGYHALQSKISSAISSIDGATTTAAAEQLQNSSPLLTLLRVARSGIDTAASSVLASQLLLTSDPAVTNHQGRVDRRVAVAENHLKTAYESNDSSRKEQISWFLCRAVYFQVLSMDAFRATLAADRRKPVSLIPSKFYTSFESLALLTAVPPPSSVLDLFDGYAQTRVNLERALPPTSRIGSPPTRTIVAAALSICVTSPQHERLPMDAYLTPLQTTLAEKLRVELSQKSKDIIDAILFVMTLSTTIPFLFNALQADSDVQPVYTRGPPPPAEERQATAAFFAAQALDRIAGILQALCRDNNGATQRVSVADVRAASEHVIDQILAIRCPHCRAPFDGFEGCFAITCMCDQDFCGWCYEMSEDSLANHVHVLACPFGLNGRGHFYGTVVQWAESNTRWRVQKLQAYFNTIDDGALRSAIAGNLLPQLLALGIDIGTVGANPIVSAKTLIGDLEPVLKQLSTSLFGNANGTSNAVWWLCSKISLVAANNNGHAAQQLHTWDDVLAHFTAPAGENPLEWVAERQAATTNARSPAINTLLQLPPILEAEALLPEQERHQWLHRHYRYRSVFDATKAFWSVVESNNSFAALKRLHQASSAIPQYLCATQNEAYCRILQFVKKLQVAARRHHLTRATAETTTLQHWNSTHPFVAERELEQLESDVRLIWSCVEDVFCKTKRDLIGADVATDVFEVSTARVSSMLPGSSFTDKNGGFILALLHGRSHASGWQGLFESSNNVQQVLQEHNVPQGPNAHHRLFSLQPSDLLEYDEHTLVTTVLPMFIDPTAPASGFTHDVAAKVVQWSLSQPGIHGKPSLLPVLDDHPALMEGAVEAFKYADEVSSSVITLQQKLPFELITEESGIEAAIQELIRYDPEFADAARSFISVLIRELASCSVRIQLPVLAEAAYKSMATPLLPIQSRAAFAIFSRLGTRLRTSHLVPLLTLVWNMDNIVPSARQPFPEHSSIPVQVATVVKKFVHDERIQVVLRLIACVMYLQPTNVFSEHYFDSSLMDVVYSVKEEKAFEDFAALEDSHTLPYMHETICCVKQSLEDALQEAEIRRVQEYHQQSQLQANDDHAASHDNHRIHSLNLAAAQQRSTNFTGVVAMTPRMNLDGRSGGGGFVLRSAVALGDSQDSRATTAGASGRDRSSGGRHSDGHPQATATNVTNMWLVDPCLNYGDV
ncbi:Hypothetical protein, putative [Bodo saltans]|uniref:Uncharacterized protein n=1 Tax=Bodo saltans TaxID=75058 RepID=A0A0S4IRU0_BODSA|nr:Hypothetical protein, putative [Bodo saltans]|eukprot:CUE70727.1 Hypothetical protein, putative [Bodo saltans]